MFNPTIGTLAYLLGQVGITWNYHLNGNQAMILVVIAAAWKQISYNFLFFLAGMGDPEVLDRGRARRFGPSSSR
jgi:sn-glycerol 3-phosphate transport system permease protein